MKRMQFKNRIAVYRAKLKLTQQELADQINVTRNALKNWETHRCMPSEENTAKLLRRFKCSWDKLFYKI